MRIGILTVSDLGAVGQREDTSGDAILAWAGERGYDVAVRSVVPDESDRIAGMLARWADSGEVDVILTTGGTGLTLRDVTPEATQAVLERAAPGIPGAPGARGPDQRASRDRGLPHDARLVVRRRAPGGGGCGRRRRERRRPGTRLHRPDRWATRIVRRAAVAHRARPLDLHARPGRVDGA